MTSVIYEILNLTNQHELKHVVLDSPHITVARLRSVYELRDARSIYYEQTSYSETVRSLLKLNPSDVIPVPYPITREQIFRIIKTIWNQSMSFWEGVSQLSLNITNRMKELEQEEVITQRGVQYSAAPFKEVITLLAGGSEKLYTPLLTNALPHFYVPTEKVYQMDVQSVEEFFLRVLNSNNYLYITRVFKMDY